MPADSFLVELPTAIRLQPWAASSMLVPLLKELDEHILRDPALVPRSFDRFTHANVTGLGLGDRPTVLFSTHTFPLAVRRSGGARRKHCGGS